MGSDYLARRRASEGARDLWARANGIVASEVRVHPISATEAYVIAPPPTLGAIALRLIKANHGDTTTPSSSLGVNFGDWRLWGVRALNHVSDLAIPRDKLDGGTYIIPGHGRICDEADVV